MNSRLPQATWTKPKDSVEDMAPLLTGFPCVQIPQKPFSIRKLEQSIGSFDPHHFQHP